MRWTEDDLNNWQAKQIKKQKPIPLYRPLFETSEAEQRYNITPVAKPRMTKRDKWLKRSVVEKYWEFKRNIQKHLG